MTHPLSPRSSEPDDAVAVIEAPGFRLDLGDRLAIITATETLSLPWFQRVSLELTRQQAAPRRLFDVTGVMLDGALDDMQQALRFARSLSAAPRRLAFVVREPRDGVTVRACFALADPAVFEVDAFTDRQQAVRWLSCSH
ncbi:MAG: hypothetical protein R3E86_15565 [Pseudomonadales bacterium]